VSSRVHEAPRDVVFIRLLPHPSWVKECVPLLLNIIVLESGVSRCRNGHSCI